MPGITDRNFLCDSFDNILKHLKGKKNIGCIQVNANCYENNNKSKYYTDKINKCTYKFKERRS